jgi:hypothetical protein
MLWDSPIWFSIFWTFWFIEARCIKLSVDARRRELKGRED